MAHAATGAGQLLNLSKLGSRLGVDGKTVANWLGLLEQMFLVRRIRAWHRSDLRRLVKAPKLHFVDAGLLAALTRVGSAQVAEERQRLGALLECFVYGELAKATAVSDEPFTISHYRDKSRIEVDFVIENAAGDVVGIEVKAAATVHPRDFRGLFRLKEAVGGQFACGIVLHDGGRVQRVADEMYAMPVGALWQLAP